MKRVILSLLIGWVVLYTMNHLLLSASHKPFELRAQLSKISTDRHINSWGPYLIDVPSSRPSTPRRSREPQPLEELASNQSDAEPPVKSESRPVIPLAPSPEPLKSVELDKSAPKLETNQRETEPPAKSEARPVIERLASRPPEFLQSAEIAKDGPEFTSHSEKSVNEVRPVVQNLAPTPAERLNKTTEVAKNPRVALNLSEDERPARIGPAVENLATGTSRKSPKIAKNVEPRSITEIKPDPDLSFRAPIIGDRRTSARNPTRLAQAVPNLDGSSHLAPIPRSRGLGLFMFAPPGF